MWCDRSHMAALLFIGVGLFLAGLVVLQTGQNLIGALLMCGGIAFALIGFSGLRLNQNLEELQEQKRNH